MMLPFTNPETWLIVMVNLPCFARFSASCVVAFPVRIAMFTLTVSQVLKELIYGLDHCGGCFGLG